MKNRCYPKYSFVPSIVLAVILLVFSLGALVIETGEGWTIKILFGGSMLTFSIIMTLAGLYELQYFYIENNVLYVKSVFGIITKLDLNNAKAYVEFLPTYFSRASCIMEMKWICIYDKNNLNFRSRFRYGYSNRKNKKRIQIVYSEENFKIIEKYIQMETTKILRSLYCQVGANDSK